MNRYLQLLSFSIILSTNLSFSQTGNVGIGTASPNSSATLDITDDKRGLLVPRIELTATNLAAPIVSPAVSLLVYNTKTAGTVPNNVTPGYYYWSGTTWIRLMNTKTLNANNGLSITNDTLIQLGGALIQPTIVSGLTAINKMSFTGTGVDAFNVDGTTLSIDATNDRIGVGTSTPNAQLQLGNSIANRKVVLYEDANNDHQYYGLGINASTSRYQVSNTSANHIFYAGTSATTSAELMRIEGDGDIYGKFRHITYQTVLNSAGFFGPNTTIDELWLAAPGGDGGDDCWNCVIDYKRGFIAPYNGRLVKVIVRIRSNGGSNPDIQGVPVLNVNGTKYAGTTQFSINDAGVNIITLPTTGFSFNEGDLIALGLRKRGNNSDRFEDIEIFVTAVWQYDIQD